MVDERENPPPTVRNPADGAEQFDLSKPAGAERMGERFWTPEHRSDEATEGFDAVYRTWRDQHGTHFDDDYRLWREQTGSNFSDAFLKWAGDRAKPQG